LSVQAFTVKAAPSGRRVDVTGELDLAARDAFRAVLDRCMDGGADVTVGLSGVTFIDSSALTVLVRARSELSSSGGRLIVANPSRVVVRVVQLAGLVGFLDIDGAGE
jgi:anti-sigma B factor antagonist